MFDKMRWRACRQRVVCRGATVVSPFKVHRTYATFDRARSTEPEVTGQPLHPVSQLNTWFIEIHFEYSNNRSVPIIIVGSHRLVRLHFVKLVAWKVINIWNNRDRIVLELVTGSYRLVFRLEYKFAAQITQRCSWNIFEIFLRNLQDFDPLQSWEYSITLQFLSISIRF